LRTNYQHRSQVKAQIRAVIAFALLFLWAISALTGFLLYVAPTGQRSGRLILLFLTKSAWGDVHFWISMAAGVITIIHIIIDWKALKACMRFLVSTERDEQPRV
jgi:hypothetical protein